MEPLGTFNYHDLAFCRLFLLYPNLYSFHHDSLLGFMTLIMYLGSFKMIAGKCVITENL